MSNATLRDGMANVKQTLTLLTGPLKTSSFSLLFNRSWMKILRMNPHERRRLSKLDILLLIHRTRLFKSSCGTSDPNRTSSMHFWKDTLPPSSDHTLSSLHFSQCNHTSSFNEQSIKLIPMLFNTDRLKNGSKPKIGIRLRKKSISRTLSDSFKTLRFLTSKVLSR